MHAMLLNPKVKCDLVIVQTWIIPSTIYMIKTPTHCSKSIFKLPYWNQEIMKLNKLQDIQQNPR